MTPLPLASLSAPDHRRQVFLCPQRHSLWMGVALFLIFGLSPFAQAQPRDESGGTHVRETEPLSPEEQLQTFHLPPGFEIELFAAEPDIGKPMNIAFDAAGRLWVTQSGEYPFAAEPGEGQDRITVLEDTDGDGRADVFTPFVEDLNIPIGILPLSDGAIAHSIPSVFRFHDSSQDLQADRRETLIGSFQYKDTHGMVNNFIRGFDGWVHACHGFHNVSTVSARDGHEVTMSSGSTFRFPTDGSRMEVTTTGRVNPFGQAYDEWGYLYSSDCHSTPIYQLIRGATYPTFHSSPGGIGYGPRMMKHTHGPTAISGLAFYTAEQFPPEFRENFYAGNVVSNRVKRDSIQWHGSTPAAVQEPDFLISDDPWFRPVDLKVGPDGALYIADFYNRIIGHYEVPLDHPGRDSHRGRIWRIVYRGEEGKAAPATNIDLAKATLDELLEALPHPNLSLRFLAADQITDRIGAGAVEELLASWADTESPPTQKVMILWVLHRLDALPAALLDEAANSLHEIIRVHSMRVIAEMDPSGDLHRDLARTALADESAHVRRAAAEALARMPNPEHVDPLLALFHKTPARDTHLRYTIRQSLRDTLRHESILSTILDREWNVSDAAVLADVMTGVDHPQAAAFLLTYLQRRDEPPENTARYLRHAALHLPEDHLATFARIGRDVAGEDVAMEMDLFESMHTAIRQRGLALSSEARAWGEEIAFRVIGSPPATGGWRYSPHSPTDQSGDPWAINPTPSQDGQTLPFLSSRTIDESFMGILRSPEFSLPETLSLYLAGHAGFPDRTAHEKNFILLRSAKDGAILRQAFPPRNDLAVKVDWNLAEREGERATLELVDGDGAHAYAWIAAGRFDPSVVEVPELGTGEQNDGRLRAIAIASELRAKSLFPDLKRIALSPEEGDSVRVAAAEALGRIDAEAAVPLLVTILAAQEQPASLRGAAAIILARSDSDEAKTVLRAAIADASRPVQRSIAAEFASTPDGQTRLLDMIAAGIVPVHLLLDPVIEERLLAAIDPKNRKRYQQLTDGVSPLDIRLQEKIEATRQSFRQEVADSAAGRQLFTLNCASCHQAGGRGGLIGPQLDGIGNWGSARLIEKIIAPNRTVSQSFRYSTLSLADGRTFTGLYQREEGEVLIFADATGKESTIAKDDILERRESPYSLMPAIFGDTLSETEIHNLVSYLLTLE